MGAGRRAKADLHPVQRIGGKRRGLAGYHGASPAQTFEVPVSPTPPSRAQQFARQVDWNLFRVFYEIGRCGSISATARALNLQQPSVSAALKRLEDRLDTALCIRKSSGIELTPAGQTLFLRCAALLEQVQAMPQDLARTRSALQGTLHVCMLSQLISPRLDTALAAYHARYPDVAIRIDVAPWRAVIEAVRAGEASLGIACDSAPSPALRYEVLMRETQQLYCGPAHPLYGQGPFSPNELAAQRFIHTGEDEPAALEAFRQRFGLGQQRAGFAEDLHEVRWLIELGVGLGFLPTVVAAKPPQRDALWPLLSPDLLPSYDVFLITRQAPAADPLTERLLHEVQRDLRG